MEVMWIAIVLIVGMGVFTDYSTKKLKIKHKIIQDQLKLEEIKQKNFMLETEKLRLELMDPQKNDYISSTDELLKIKTDKVELTKEKKN